MTATPRDELRPTVEGELARTREHARELAVLLEGLSRSVGDAFESKDPAIVAERLGAVVLSGAAMLNELGEVAGRLDTLARG